MYILDYDEFNIYTTSSDVKNFIENLIEEGIVFEKEAYERCIDYFGKELKSLIDEIFTED